MSNDEALTEVEELLKVAKTSIVVDALEILRKELSSSSSLSPLVQGLSPENLNKIRSAARMGELQQLQTLITEDVKGDPLLSSNEGDFMGLTPLHWAVAAGSTKNRLECVQFLIDSGANVEESNRLGNNALHYAAATRKVECMKLLLGAKSDIIDNKGESGQTALHMSAAKGDIEGVELCLQYKANVNARDVNEDTALHLAVRMGQNECINLLIKSGADVSAINSKGVKASEEKEAELINSSYE